MTPASGVPEVQTQLIKSPRVSGKAGCFEGFGPFQVVRMRVKVSLKTLTGLKVRNVAALLWKRSDVWILSTLEKSWH